MRYAVIFQVGGAEQMAELDAPDAATAAELIHDEHGKTDELFELLSVQLLDDPLEVDGEQVIETDHGLSAAS